jgi:GR25 family glycosyltransferase involved in LPS biosynthesis
VKPADFNTYIIGVPGRYRGLNLEKRLVTEKISFFKIAGVDGSTMGTSDYLQESCPHISKKILGRVLTKGEVCCAVAHEKAYESFLQGAAGWALILEDDCELNPRLFNFTLYSELNSAVPTIIQLYGSAIYAEQVARWPWMRGKILKEVKTKELLRIRRFWELPQGTYGYLINREAAKLAVRSMRGGKHITTADWPVQWREKVTYMITRDPVVFTNDISSLLEAERELARETEISNSISEDLSRIAERSFSSPLNSGCSIKSQIQMLLVQKKDRLKIQTRRILKFAWLCKEFFNLPFEISGGKKKERL